MKIAVGQVWITTYNQAPDRLYQFEIVAQVRLDCGRFWIGMKILPQGGDFMEIVQSQVVLFDDRGVSPKLHDLQWKLERRSRAKPRYSVNLTERAGERLSCEP